MTLHYRSVCRAVTVVGLCTALATAGGCGLHLKSLSSDQPTNSGLGSVQIPEDFTFKTASTQMVKVISDDSINFGQCPVTVYWEDADNNGEKCIVAKDYTDKQGNYDKSFKIPDYVNVLYVEIAGKNETKLIRQELNGSNSVVTLKNIKVDSANKIKTKSVGPQEVLFLLPANNRFNTLMYEDQWPQRGDYDMNDMLLYSKWKLMGYVNDDGDSVVEKAVGTYYLSAMGAEKHLGFAIQFDKAQYGFVEMKDVIDSFVVKINNVETKNFTYIASSDPNERPTLVLFNDYTTLPIAPMWNTSPDSNNPAAIIEITINLKTDKLSEQISFANSLNPYIFMSNETDKEVHLPGRRATYAGNLKGIASGYFTSGINAPDVKVTGYDYRAQDNSPWAMEVWGAKIKYPNEYTDICLAYPSFTAWVSGGSVTWYKNPVLEKVHAIPANVPLM